MTIRSAPAAAMTTRARRHVGRDDRVWRLAWLAACGCIYAAIIRPWLLRWGATAGEMKSRLPGDDLVADAAYVTTRAITIHTPSQTVWPWLVQLGQGRGGFYTYDRLEQLIGAAIHSTDRIMPEFQQLGVGDTVRLSPVGGPRVVLPGAGPCVRRLGRGR